MRSDSQFHSVEVVWLHINHAKKLNKSKDGILHHFVLEHDVLEYYASDVIIITTQLPSTLDYGQWKLVKYIIKTSMKYFIEPVIDEQGGQIKVKFVRRHNKDSNNFKWSDKDDVDIAQTVCTCEFGCQPQADPHSCFQSLIQ